MAQGQFGLGVYKQMKILLFYSTKRSTTYILKDSGSYFLLTMTFGTYEKYMIFF